MSSKQGPPSPDDPRSASSSEGEEASKKSEGGEDEQVSESEQHPKQPPTCKPTQSESSKEEEEEEEGSEVEESGEESDEEEEDEQAEQPTAANSTNAQEEESGQSREEKGEDGHSQEGGDDAEDEDEEKATTVEAPARQSKSPSQSRNITIKPIVSKNSSSNRLWSDEDEIVILRSLTEFQSKFSKDPSANREEFHGFIKKSLHVEVTRNQLMDKVRRLKSKFLTWLNKSTDGGDPDLANPHDSQCFHLGKKFWGNITKNSNAAVGGINSANNHRSKRSGDGETSRSAKKTRISSGNGAIVCVPVESAGLVNESAGLVNVNGDDDDDDFAKVHPFLMGAFSSNKLVSGLDALKTNLRLIPPSQLKEAEKRWKEINIAEAEIALRRLDLIKMQATMVLAAMKASNH